MLTVWKKVSGAGVTYPEGFVAAGVRCGLKTLGNDLMLLVSDSEASVAGVFTTNRVQAACVQYSRRVARGGRARAVIVNAGNANALNGERGEEDNRTLADWVSRRLHVAPDLVLTASTGIIGHLLPMDKLEAGIENAVASLEEGPEADMGAAEAIMTTDTEPKYAAVEVDSDAWVAPIRIGGVCKGSGMIAPNMATMLAFLTTDVRMPSDLLQEALTRAAAVSFNSVTVDGDTSTNDLCLLLASGMGEGEITSKTGAGFEDFVEALSRLCIELAKEIARDGEGATKLVTVNVIHAALQEHAHKIAKTIAESPLVKTAIFGSDPNWGRILMAAGRAGVPLDLAVLEVKIGEIVVCSEGRGVDFDRDAAHAYLAGHSEISLTVDLQMGDESASVFTCDYSYDYIKINAEYHT